MADVSRPLQEVSRVLGDQWPMCLGQSSRVLGDQWPMCLGRSFPCVWRPMSDVSWPKFPVCLVPRTWHTSDLAHLGLGTPRTWHTSATHLGHMAHLGHAESSRSRPCPERSELSRSPVRMAQRRVQKCIVHRHLLQPLATARQVWGHGRRSQRSAVCQPRTCIECRLASTRVNIGVIVDLGRQSGIEPQLWQRVEAPARVLQLVPDT